MNKLWTIQVTYNGGVYIRDEQGREMAYTDNKKAAEEIVESVNAVRSLTVLNKSSNDVDSNILQ